MTAQRKVRGHKTKSAADILKLVAAGKVGGLFLYVHGLGDPDWPGMQLCIDNGWIDRIGPGGDAADGRKTSWYKLTPKGREVSGAAGREVQTPG